MATWLGKVREDIGNVVSALAYYEVELDQARLETSLRGNLERNSRDMPGIIEHRFNQLQEIESLLEFLNIELHKTRGHHFRKYLEKYQRQLSSRDAEKFADGEPDVVDMQHIINEVALIRNKFIGVTKALESKQFQINNIVKLRAAGLDDVSL